MTSLAIESRHVNTTKFGCRHTSGVRHFVVGTDIGDSYERGIASVAHKTMKSARESVAMIKLFRERKANAA